MAKRYAKAVGTGTLVDLTDGGADAGTYFLAVCNRETAERTFRVAITDGGSVTPADYINYDTPIEGNGEFGRWPIVLGAGWKVFVQASGTGLSATIIGREG